VRRLPLLLATLLLAACGSGSGSSGTGVLKTTAGTPVAASVGEIEATPGSWAGKTVVVAGPVTKHLGPQGFVVGTGTQQPTQGNRVGLLVLTKEARAVKPGNLVKVTGRVVLFRRNGDLGFRLEQPSAYARFYGQPAVILRTIGAGS
jgi:hypothetical protein